MTLANLFKKRTDMPNQMNAPEGRQNPIPTAQTHFVNGNTIQQPFPKHLETVIFGLG